MRFTLKNLGKLEEATIDLGKDLIVLTGPNNTSKTYVAHAIHGLCRKLPLLAGALALDGGFQQSIPRPSGPDLSEQITVDILEVFDQHTKRLLTTLSGNYQAHLADVFATDASFVARAQVRLESDSAELASARRRLFEQEIHQPPSLGTFGFDKSAGSSKWVLSDLSKPPAHAPPSPQPLPRLSLLFTARAHAANTLFEALFHDILAPHVLTAERAAIQLFSRELSFRRNDMVDAMLKSVGEGASAGGGADDPLTILRQRAQRYPLAIREGLRSADDLALLKKTASPFAQVADLLERDLLQGSIQVGEDGDMTFLPERASTPLTMHLASSSVKALSGLSFYLRHQAHSGQFLIIDEPELNLHPHHQRRVARFLARLSRSGIKVLISTHSDYIVRELNNLLMLSADEGGEVREKHGYDAAETLSPERVGAYLFDGAHAHPIPIEPAGIVVSAIDKEISDLNRSSRDIYFSLIDKDGP